MINNVISPEYNEEGRVMRRVRSFVRRQGRLTQRQEDALQSEWEAMGIDFVPQPFDFTAVFNNANPVVLEIGFGMGASLVTMAAQNPEKNFLGIEVHAPGVGACLASAKEENITNLRVMCHDAIEVLDTMIPDGSLSMVQLFFPDPWHKAKHNKRRIVQTPFADKIRTKLAVGGVFHMATDWQPYAEHMLEVMTHAQGYKNLSTTGDYVPRPETRPETKFEKRGQRLGHGVWDLMFERTK
ncbi:tRNA (guanosine(46)-N7)-methyltransferase TrmB [Providencia stuartii]|uniref:tRNA (guanine-N(7)-)-methyltransferase n=2 Tax=Providencia TaxID=586 RepID=A0A1S1HQD3_PROST|nr:MULTISPECIES: tRNA (guanosine(46)-N7)-methyltransferase TrmB [Providencia]MDV5227888.1 tRNA (guanosine(46)-N7)-methyltransferase TrmB [Providencia rettgeri]ELR5038539.1 tRNA (guanosine(46)-N7)-methyltransferase TrmB [Providencia stuartii]ELR5084141.1 tRNA (guanosine(46)-N7)-methyltransferase TrmB [Providencia stuartii]ELR5114740.1 tRNA (guanosine(46)-N7)-methyltransferase TrmB [Providencia stuartii]ELR5300307.1 tRNA (guanosine(46)-N7)-methyltransferase TrmB [Providencia stuartii]